MYLVSHRSFLAQPISQKVIDTIAIPDYQQHTLIGYSGIIIQFLASPETEKTYLPTTKTCLFNIHIADKTPLKHHCLALHNNTVERVKIAHKKNRGVCRAALLRPKRTQNEAKDEILWHLTGKRKEIALQNNVFAKAEWKKAEIIECLEHECVGQHTSNALTQPCSAKILDNYCVCTENLLSINIRYANLLE